ncbi:MAG: outer membrane protein assembly factor, partial [Sinomicrobium sp.]|nr:outer membrane protein assembly factor [Sinomicrobium sp.]
MKRVSGEERLLTKSTVYVNEKKNKSEEVQRMVLQKPNSSVLGIPLRLHIYNLAKKDPDSAFQRWLHKREKRAGRLSNFLSEKQVVELGNSYSGINNWLKKTGEAPVVIDD